jgi:hypothetical protein
MFWFPYNIDNVHSRLTAAMTSIICLTVAVFYRDAYGRYMAPILFAEYTCRVLFGGRASIVGAVAYGIAFHLPPIVYEVVSCKV